jgi:hypothetical protein
VVQRAGAGDESWIGGEPGALVGVAEQHLRLRLDFRGRKIDAELDRHQRTGWHGTLASSAGGARAYALASTDLSLHSLLEESDFSAAALLLNVLGEGTFLDLLQFVERHAPDAATAAAARLAHRDERRHVQFGIRHVRRRLALGPEELEALVGAAEARAAKLTSLSGLSAVLTESLILLASPSLQPADLSEAGTALRELMQTMERNRVRRLRAAGFALETPRHLSDLHTPNLM